MSAPLPPPACQVLIVEDEFHLAEDMAGGLCEPGAEIIGRVASAGSALALLNEWRPDLVVLDINLGLETNFDLGRRLLADGLP